MIKKAFKHAAKKTFKRYRKKNNRRIKTGKGLILHNKNLNQGMTEIINPQKRPQILTKTFTKLAVAVVKQISAGVWQSSFSTTTNGFQINLMPNWSVYQSMFQYYKITKLKYIWTILADNASGAGAIDPVIYQRYCYEPGYVQSVYTNALTAITQMTNVAKHKFTQQNGAIFEYVVYPKTVRQVLQFGTSVLGNEVEKPKWFDTLNDTVNFLGMNYVFDELTSSASSMSIALDIQCTVQFKDLKE